MGKLENLTPSERIAVDVALTLLVESIEDGNDHLFPEMSAEQIRALAERLRP